ncbi:MAG: transposase [Verrucomicrobiota bacterium]
MPAHFTPRKLLHHNTPSWVDESSALFFITINCAPQGKNQLAESQIAKQIKDALQYRIDKSQLYPHIFLLMPDHLHSIIGYSATTNSLTKIISSFKQRLAQQNGIQWQKGFFDHRIRNESSYREKFEYILQNPIRRKLCKEPENWPYKWYASDFR